MAIRTHPDRITTEPREQPVSPRRGPPVPRPDGRRAVPERASGPAGDGKPSMAGRPHPDHPYRQVGPAGRVLVVGLTCFFLWALLATPSLRRSAESSPLGFRRTAALAVLRPLARASAVLGLDRLESGVDRALGRTHKHEPMPPLAGTLGLGPVSSPTGVQPEPSPSHSLSADRGVRPPATYVPHSPTPAFVGPFVHRPTRARPLRVLAVGDSIGEDLAIGLARALSGRRNFVLRTDARQATGLARPDYFDWAYQIAVDIREFRPDVVVAAFGANDGQSFIAGGHGVRIGTSEWKRIYRQRVGRIMAEVLSSARPVIWVGMPPMASSRLSQNMWMIDGLARAEAARRPGALYLDSWDLFSGSSGGYSAYLPNPSGEQQLVRTSDGIHLTAAGLDRLAGAVLRVMRGLWTSTARYSPRATAPSAAPAP
jgi:hypothetical protein